MTDKMMSITTHGKTAVATVREPSLLDATVVEELGRRLFEVTDVHQCRKIVLDFSTVQFLSSSIVGVILALSGKVRQDKGKIIIYGLRPRLQEMVMLTKPDRKVVEFTNVKTDIFRAVDPSMRG